MKLSVSKLLTTTTMALGLLAVGLSTSVTHAKTLKMMSAYPLNLVYSEEVAKTYIKNVEKASGGSLQIELLGPETIPAFEQFEPLQSGVFDLLLTHPAYHSGTTAVGLSIDAIAVDPTARRESGVFDYIDEHYMARDVKLLSAPASGRKGFRFYLKNEVEETPGLDGLKIRGTVSYHGMIRELGGSPVNMPGGEVYTSLQKGVVDGAAWGLSGAKDFKWYEVSKYLGEPSFGQVGNMIFMNANSFSGVTAEEQKILIDEGIKLELWTLDRFDTIAKEELDFLQEEGMTFTSFSDEEGANFDGMWAKSVWQVAEELSGDDVKKLRKIAKDSNLTE